MTNKQTIAKYLNDLDSAEMLFDLLTGYTTVEEQRKDFDYWCLKNNTKNFVDYFNIEESK